MCFGNKRTVSTCWSGLTRWIVTRLWRSAVRHLLQPSGDKNIPTPPPKVKQQQQEAAQRTNSTPSDRLARRTDRKTFRTPPCAGRLLQQDACSRTNFRIMIIRFIHLKKRCSNQRAPPPYQTPVRLIWGQRSDETGAVCVPHTNQQFWMFSVHVNVIVWLLYRWAGKAPSTNVSTWTPTGSGVWPVTGFHWAAQSIIHYSFKKNSEKHECCNQLIKFWFHYCIIFNYYFSINSLIPEHV